MSRTKTRQEGLAELAEKEIKSHFNPLVFNCGKTDCPVLKNINNVPILKKGDKYYPEIVKLIDLFPGVGEYSENTESTFHQIARTGLEEMGFSFDSSLEGRNPLDDSGIHMVANPRFRYDD